MSTVLWRTLAVLFVFAGGFTAGVLWHEAAEGPASTWPPPPGADHARVVIQCPPERVPTVLEKLRDEPAEVWTQLAYRPVDAEAREVVLDAPLLAREGERLEPPPLPDAVAVLQAIEAAFDTIEGPLVELTECSIRQRKATVTVTLPAGVGEQVRAALARSPGLAARGVVVEPGTMARLAGPAQRLKAHFTLRFDERKPGRDGVRGFEGGLHRTVMTSSVGARMRMTWAGVEKRETDAAGRTTTTRQYKFQNAKIVDMRALLAGIAELDPTLTVIEVHWKVMRQPDGRLDGVLAKPTLTVAGRSAP